jgi:tRNA pseudouridine38-40 synthase
MMCVLVLTCRTNTPQQIIDEVCRFTHTQNSCAYLYHKLYGPRTVFVPKMPSLGLLLERPIFDSYNAKVSIINEKVEPSHPDYRPAIDFEPYRETIEKFKQVHIYEQMRAIEDRDAM